MAGILLTSIGLGLAYTWAFADVQCSGDFCMITWNVLALRSIVVGTVLGMVSVIMSAGQRFRDPLTAKH